MAASQPNSKQEAQRLKNMQRIQELRALLREMKAEQDEHIQEHTS